MSNQPGNIQYSYAQLEYIWDVAGGNPGAAPLAAAIAMAESSGNSTATNNDSNGTVDRGLWQINSVHGAQSTYDVMGNARAAIAISNNGNDWTPWTTFNNGAYQQFLTGGVPAQAVAINATNAAGNQSATDTAAQSGTSGCSFWQWIGVQPFTPPGSGAGTPLGVGGPISCLNAQAAQDASGVAAGVINAIIGSVLNPVINWIAGMAGIGAGLILVGGGAIMIVRQTQAGQQATGAAGRVAGGAIMGAALGPEGAAAGAAEGAMGGLRRSSGTLNRVMSARDRQAAAQQAAQRRAQGTTRVTYSQSGRTGPRGEPLRTQRITTTRDGVTTTESTQQILRNEVWDYYRDPGKGRAGPY